MPHQIEDIEFGFNHNKFINANDMGLGKTFETLQLIEIKKIKHCLIVCGLNSLKHNWGKEIEKFTNSDYIILDELDGKKLTSKQSCERLKNKISQKYIIVNREKLQLKDFIECFKKSKTNFDAIVCDEIHRFKSPSSKSSKTLLKLDAKYKIALSGTIIINDPEDAYIPLKWIDATKSNFSNFKSCYNVYGGFQNRQVIGHQNLDELKDLLNTCTIRRKKEDVLDLPAKIHLTEYIDMYDDQKRLYDEVRQGIAKELDKLENKPTIIQELSMCIRLRQITAYPGMLSSRVDKSAKLDRLYELIEDIIKQGDKVVVFSTFKETAKKIYQDILSYNPILCTGDQSDIEIDKNKKLFDLPENKVLIATWQKMGTGHTLTQANYVIFVDTPWTQADFNQAEDRCYRIGQNKSVTVITLICNDSYDLRVKDILQGKDTLTKYINGEIS